MPVPDDGSSVPTPDTQPATPATPANNEPPAPTGGTPDAGKDAEASREAAKAGESRKRMAEGLIRLAAKDDEARAQLKELAKDPYEKTYLERKFGESFTSLIKDPEAPSQDPVVKDPEVQALINDRKVQRQETLDSVKKELGLTMDQASEFDDLVKELEGKKIGGKTVTFRDAAEMAARQLVPNMPSISSLTRGDVQKRPEDSKDEAKVSIPQSRVDRYSHLTGAKSAKDFSPIVEQLAKNGTYTVQL